VLAHHARDQRHALPVERVGDTLHGDRVKAGVAHHDLHGRHRGGITFVGRLDILLQHIADGGQPVQKRRHRLARLGLAVVALLALDPLAGVFEGAVGLVAQPQRDVAQGVLEVAVTGVMRDRRLPVAAGIEHGQQGVQHGDHRAGARQVDVAFGIGDRAILAGRERLGQRIEILFQPLFHKGVPKRAEPAIKLIHTQSH